MEGRSLDPVWENYRNLSDGSAGTLKPPTMRFWNRLLCNSHMIQKGAQLSRSSVWSCFACAARGNVVGWGPMLQAERARVRIPMKTVWFFNLPTISSRTVFLGGGGCIARSFRKADFTYIGEHTLWKMRELRYLTILWSQTACCRELYVLTALCSVCCVLFPLLSLLYQQSKMYYSEVSVTSE